MSKQVIAHWTPSPSDDVDYQEVRCVINPSSPAATVYGPYKLNRAVTKWSTKTTGIPLLEGDEIELTVTTVDTSGLRDANPPTRRFAIPAVPPSGATDLSFQIADYAADPDAVPPVEPTEPVPTDSLGGESSMGSDSL